MGTSLGETQGIPYTTPRKRPVWAQEGHLQHSPSALTPTLKSRFKDVDLPWEIPAAITAPE